MCGLDTHSHHFIERKKKYETTITKWRRHLHMHNYNQLSSPQPHDWLANENFSTCECKWNGAIKKREPYNKCQRIKVTMDLDFTITCDLANFFSLSSSSSRFAFVFCLDCEAFCSATLKVVQKNKWTEVKCQKGRKIASQTIGTLWIRPKI